MKILYNNIIQYFTTTTVTTAEHTSKNPSFLFSILLLLLFRTMPKEGFQVSKREWEGCNKELARGVKKQGDCAIIMLSICIHVYNNCLNAECS